MEKPVVAVHVWSDEYAARERDVDTYYSVSLVDEDDEEVRCVGGSRVLARAWEMACAEADDRRVPALEYARSTDEVTDRYHPPEVET